MLCLSSNQLNCLRVVWKGHVVSLIKQGSKWNETIQRHFSWSDLNMLTEEVQSAQLHMWDINLLHKIVSRWSCVGKKLMSINMLLWWHFLFPSFYTILCSKNPHLLVSTSTNFQEGNNINKCQFTKEYEDGCTQLFFWKKGKAMSVYDKLL